MIKTMQCNRKETLNLLKLVLKEKWNTQKYNYNTIDSVCAFCKNALKKAKKNNFNEFRCNYCLCPRSLCCNNAQDGIISQLELRAEVKDSEYKLIKFLTEKSFEKMNRAIKNEITKFELLIENKKLLETSQFKKCKNIKRER